MSIRTFFKKVKYKLDIFFFQYPRVLKYCFLSNCEHVYGNPSKRQPILFSGKGIIKFGKGVVFGVRTSPGFFSNYTYIDVRNSTTCFAVGNNVKVNNNFQLICEGNGVQIKQNTLIGLNVQIIDSDFHSLDPSKRFEASSKTKEVIIGENVFIGNNVTVLKGVEIGDNSVIGSNSVVTQSIPKNVIACGNPCRVIKNL